MSVRKSLIGILAAYGFSLLFADIFPKEGTMIRLLAVTVCMATPYIMGLSTVCLYDYAAVCVTLFLLWTACSRKWPLFIATGLFTSFIKEPGVIYFGAICAVVLMWELICE